MATMSMNKAIHQAFRRDLDRFVGALGRFPAGDSARAAALGRAWDNFDFQLTKHHTGEHETAWPALAKVGVSQQLLEQMDAEHDVMAERLAAARSAITALRSDPSAANATTAQAAMSELRTVAGDHLDHEERELEPVFAAKHDDPVIKAMGKEFAKVGPKEGGVFFAWVLDHADADTEASVRSTIPRPVLAVLKGVFGRSYTQQIEPVWS